MGFTSTINTHQTTSTVMIYSTLPDKDDCKEVMSGFEDGSASAEDRKDYAYCVQIDQPEPESIVKAAGPAGSSLIVIAFVVIFLLAPLAKFTNKNRS